MSTLLAKSHASNFLTPLNYGAKREVQLFLATFYARSSDFAIFSGSMRGRPVVRESLGVVVENLQLGTAAAVYVEKTRRGVSRGRAATP